MPLVRGIPKDAVRLSDAEVKQITDKLQGNWHIQPLQGGGQVVNRRARTQPLQFTDAFVDGTTLIV
eukprot:365000-Hanusia_phi.AAC.1